VTPAGHLIDPDSLESEVKRTMVRRAQRAALLVDGSKFGRAALTQIATVDDLAVVLAAGVPDDRLERIERAARPLRESRVQLCTMSCSVHTVGQGLIRAGGKPTGPATPLIVVSRSAAIAGSVTSGAPLSLDARSVAAVTRTRDP
jgi:hypothetical protein